MIFLVENQLPYRKPEEACYSNVLPFLESSLIYQCLYGLNYESLLLIDQIVFVSCDCTDSGMYKAGFREFSADYRSYSQDNPTILEIFDRFPKDEQLIDAAKRKLIEHLIQSTDYLSSYPEKMSASLQEKLTEKDDRYLLFIPFIKQFSKRLIGELPNNSIKLFTDGKFSKLINETEITFVDLKLFNKIEKTLSIVNYQAENCKEMHKFIWGYKKRDVLDIFENGFSQKLADLKNRGAKRIKITGEEIFIANKVIDSFLMGEDRYYYYMPRDYNRIEEIKLSLAIFNFDQMDAPEWYYNIYNILKTLPETKYILLQTIRNIGSKYFDRYDEVSTPNTADIADKIIEVFIYILLDRQVYTDNNNKLFGILGLSKIRDLFPKLNNIRILVDAINAFQKLTYNDLISNVSFWINLKLQIEKKSLVKMSSTDNGLKRPIVFNHIGNSWEIINLTSKPITVPYGSNKGLLYLIVVLKSNRTLNSCEVKYIADCALDPKKFSEKIKTNVRNPDYDENQTARKTVSSAINVLKKNKVFRDFVKTNVKFGGYENYVVPTNKVSCEIYDPNLLDTYFE